MRKQDLHEDIRDWGELIILIFASTVSSTTASNNYSELKYSISSSPFTLRLSLDNILCQTAKINQPNKNAKTNKNKKEKSSFFLLSKQSHPQQLDPSQRSK